MNETRWRFGTRRCSILNDSGKRCASRRTATVDGCAYYCARHIEEDREGWIPAGDGKLHLDEIYLTNVPMGAKVPPRGDWWIYYLMGQRVSPSGRKRRPFVQVLMGPTRASCDRKLRAFVARPDVQYEAPCR